MSQNLRRLFFILSLSFFASAAFAADGARFDLAGPKIEVRVTRGDRTLPIAQVPNLQPGDRLWLHADLPDTQSVHLILVVCFLRGTTNPPPDQWFTKIETWEKKTAAEGTTVTVPADAQQALLFLAPETGGDFSTLRSAVKGRPGTFVRADQDLTELGFEQARVEKYLAGMRQLPPTADPKVVSDTSNKLAATLALKPNADCFKQPVDLQVTCLTQSGNQTVLDDGHGQSIVEALSNGAASDFLFAASATPMIAGGLYSPYVGAVVDLGRLLSNLHTAQYQYIPAVAMPNDVSLNLRLNAAPSFHNPKSVIVIALPGVQKATQPPLRPADPKVVTCLMKPDAVMQVTGAPLVYSTGLAHDLVLHLNGSSPQDLPLKADSYRGGLLLASAPQRRTLVAITSDSDSSQAAPPKATPADSKSQGDSNQLTGTIRGQWGFESFEGPAIPLQNQSGKDFKIEAKSDLIAGKDNTMIVHGTAVACVETIEFAGKGGDKIKAEFKPGKSNEELEVTAALKRVDPGSLKFTVAQYGDKDSQQVEAKTYSVPAELKSFDLHAGDSSGLLQGSSLDQVQSIDLNGVSFTPQGKQGDAMKFALGKDAKAPALNVGDSAKAHAKLKDGRDLEVAVNVQAARPGVTLVSKNASPSASGGPAIVLSNKEDLSLSNKLTFFLKANSGDFPRTSKIEVATTDGSLKTMLSFDDGSLVLQDASTVLATLDPAKAYGNSAFGKLQFRPVSADGSSGDWTPLVTLVRTPILKEVRCPMDDAKPCTLVGQNLYLIDSVAATSKFEQAKPVPPGYSEQNLEVPRPYGTVIYMKLRDDAASVNAVALPVVPTN